MVSHVVPRSLTSSKPTSRCPLIRNLTCDHNTDSTTVWFDIGKPPNGTAEHGVGRDDGRQGLR